MNSTTKKFRNAEKTERIQRILFQKEEQELLSEMKKRRLEDGTLQIFKSEFVVEGLLRKIIDVKPSDGKSGGQQEDDEE